MEKKWAIRGLAIFLFFLAFFLFNRYSGDKNVINEEDLMWGLYGLIFVVVILGFAYIIWASKKRREAIEQRGVEMGFEYQREDENFTSQLEMLGNIDLFQKGRGRKATNILRGRRRDFEVAIFDYRYTTGGGKSSNTHQQTVVLFSLEESEFPEFELRPRNFLDQLAAKFGRKDIDFSHRLSFSNKYYVTGDDATAVKLVINDPVITFYEQQDKLFVEADGDHLLIYRWNHVVKPDELRNLLDTATRALELMRRPRLM